ncbi:hypothetical protein JCGZ_08192 [Jatropha curcas]|uniref:Uncharacterized protein n=1 Tax=Jatropha curcas TaxID=180498 RepID=A0A067KKX6_JATCU|nr:uncharacterized protein LOC105635318 [Jatropha curcas]KDP36901.1 hypothetical protein JCGZ_08192 [Jatropha curcas]
MEAIFVPSSADQSISHKQMKNQSKRNTRSFVSRSTENLAPTNNNNIHGSGLLFAPPPSLSFSCPPSFSILYPQQIQRQTQPPLLPLPISRPYNSLPSRTRDISCPPISRKTNRTRDQSLTPKKSKQPITKREEPSQDSKVTRDKLSAKSFVTVSTAPLGPDPKDLPKDISKVISSSPSYFSVAGNTIGIKDLESFSSTVFTLSPPPSSLPLPKFSMRPKLSCTAEAAGVDDGATDNLRRLLRLR